MRYRNVELLVGAAFLLICALAWLSARSLPADARMFPALLLALLALSSVVMMIRAVTGASERVQGDEIKDWTFTAHLPRFLGGFAIFIVYLVVIPYLGFFTTSAVFVVAMSVFTGYRNWPVVLLGTIGFCIFVYLVFVLLFERPLPKEFFLSSPASTSTASEAWHA